ncbi:O-methyltransferase MdmC-like [Haliotis cracherodii]|uniref:O-methyltransferase MdmC-like n=1 Tax=Haliotis cracherodii TaxID=6455 RepID=UPI0039E79BE7
MASDKHTAKSMTLDPANKLLSELLTRSQKPDMPQDVKETLEKVVDLTDKRVEYCRKLTSPDSPSARMISEKTRNTPWSKLYDDGKVGSRFSPQWMSGSGQGQLLQFLIRMQKAKRALEIGMFTGYVAMAMAEALPEDGAVVTCEFEPYLVEMARETFDGTPHGKQIDIRQGPALKTLDSLADEGQKFDIVYLDADKTGYLAYFKKLLDRELLAPGATLVVDNTFEFGFAYTEPGSTVDQFNQAVKDDTRVEQMMLPIYDGVTLIRRKGE